MNCRYRIDTPLVFLVLALLPVLGLADIYTWTDENGVTHYSTSRPPGQPASAFPTDPAFRPPSASARPTAPPAAFSEAPEGQALRPRVETLEVLLDKERSARVSDLKDQLESERDRVRRLEAERSQWSQVGGLWTQPALGPAGVWWNPSQVYVVPGHGKPLKSEKRDRPKVRHESEHMPYPSISGPSSNLR
jgi:hypothetical protein